jgi:predicted phosphate transport protein (TIGR00153 family)
MRIPFFSMFISSPFDGLMEHAEKIKDGSLIFQQAIECRLEDNCKNYEKFRQEIITMEGEADVIKRRIRGHIPKGTLLPVDKFQIFRYLKEQDKVLDTIEDIIDWLSFKEGNCVPDELKKDVYSLVDSSIEPVEELTNMVSEARSYFRSYSEKQRNNVKEIIQTLRTKEHDADQLEKNLKRRIFNNVKEPISVFFLIRLVEAIGSIADHAENAGDMMRAMIAR